MTRQRTDSSQIKIDCEGIYYEGILIFIRVRHF